MKLPPFLPGGDALPSSQPAPPPPPVAPFTASVLAQLPEAMRVTDEQQGLPLARWLALLTDQGDEVRALRDRLAGGALSDPAAADPGWLPWLAGILGVTLPARVPERDRRGLLATEPPRRRLAGTRAELRRQIHATGPLRVEIRVLSRWSMLVDTYRAQTPDVAASARTARAEAPAWMSVEYRALPGVTLAVLPRSHPTLADVGAAFPTFADLGRWIPPGDGSDIT